MSFTGPPTELPAYVAALEQRIRALENRAVSVAAPSGLNGTGVNSSAVAGSNVATYPDASGSGAVAVGNEARAGETGVAIGEGAWALDTGFPVAVGNNVAIGKDAVSRDVDCCSIGTRSSTIIGTHSVALGADAYTSADNQIVLGTADDRTIMSGPNSAIADADLQNGRISFYLNEGGNTLTVKVKYSTGTVKTGTVALV